MALTAHPALKRDRHRAIREIVVREPIASQQELAARLAERGFAVTQATVSRDIAELGLVKVVRGDRHAYVLAADLASDPNVSRPAPTDERLRRILADVPITVGRSGLTLVLIGSPGTASVVAQAIDESSFTDQVGTLAGDNTLLVLFADEPALLRWQERFEALVASAAEAASPSTSAPSGALPEVPR